MPHTALTAPRSKSSKDRGGGSLGPIRTLLLIHERRLAFRVRAIRLLFACGGCDDGLGRPIKLEAPRTYDGNGVQLTWPR
jgi:hypothetical protein